MSCAERVVGDALRSRADRRRAVEVAIGVHVPNRTLELGRPEPVRVAWARTGGGVSAPVPPIRAPRCDPCNKVSRGQLGARRPRRTGADRHGCARQGRPSGLGVTCRGGGGLAHRPVPRPRAAGHGGGQPRAPAAGGRRGGRAGCPAAGLPRDVPHRLPHRARGDPPARRAGRRPLGTAGGGDRPGERAGPALRLSRAGAGRERLQRRPARGARRPPARQPPQVAPLRRSRPGRVPRRLGRPDAGRDRRPAARHPGLLRRRVPGERPPPGLGRGRPRRRADRPHAALRLRRPRPGRGQGLREPGLPRLRQPLRARGRARLSTG